jgi:hypothetical protein
MTGSTPDAYNVIWRFFDEGFCTGNETIADELFSPDRVEHQFGLTETGAAATSTSRTRSPTSTRSRPAWPA